MDTPSIEPIEGMAREQGNDGAQSAVLASVSEEGRASPASAVCYLDLDAEAVHQALEAARQQNTTPRSLPCDSATGPGDEMDKTPRSDDPPAAAASSQLPETSAPDASESTYFSPRPIRPYAPRLPTSTPGSVRPSPTASVDPSTVSVCSTPALPQDRRPSIQRDDSTTSTTSVATIRAHSAGPGSAYPPPPRTKLEGPCYPNQSYASLQYPRYPPISEHNPSRASRMSGPRHSHYQSLSGTSITTSGLSEHRRSFMDSGSKTAGNSPASSPGLFSPSTPPLGLSQQSEDGFYSSPYLHHMHRQAPKETHKADCDVDPVSGRKIVNQYEIIDELGRGVHGKVKLGRNLETGQTVAIKIVKRYVKPRRLNKDDGSREEKIKKEIAILKKARHPNIVGLLEVIDDPALKRVYIILEHVELGEVKWRTEGAKEICLIEWRRYQREAQGMEQDEAAIREDQIILDRAQEKIQQERMAELRERAKLIRRHRRSRGDKSDNHGWSLEFGGESDPESVGSSRTSRASTISGDQAQSRSTFAEHWARTGHHEANMETAVRTETAASSSQQFDPYPWTGLEGTQYGPYDDRDRTPSIAGSSSSCLTEEAEEVPEHFRYVPLLTLHTALEIFRDTVLGLEYLHFQGVVHRDIKPANLLQTKEHRIKISDFGVSYLGRAKQPSDDDESESDPLGLAEPEEELAKTVGTPAFYAPEICREGFHISDQLDIWALGVTLYCLVYGRVPFFNPNQHQLLENIFSDEVVIPHYRLKATVEQSGSRPSSHGRMYHTMTFDRRDPHALEYEEVGRDLRDLLQKLLIKDPQKRIKIRDIKRHPWVLQGLDNYGAWVEETDPERRSQGRRIEVTHEDMERAVVPISWSDRVRSGVRKTLDTVLGIGRRGGSRKRAQSTVTSPDALQPISTRSSSSTISQESRRPSLAMNSSILEALTRSRAESEHPLSQSVSASPEARERAKFFEPSSRTASPSHHAESREHPAPLPGTTRPMVLERAHSTTSSAASVRTVRPSEGSGLAQTPSPKPSSAPPPALPGTPTALDPGHSSTFSNLLGGVPRLVSNMRSREKLLKSKRPADPMRARTEWRGEGADDPHSEPSLALSTASAAGHVDTPGIPDVSPRARRGTWSKYADVTDHGDHLERSVSRQSSVSSTASSYLQRRLGRKTHSELGPVPTHESYILQPASTESHAEMVKRAQEEHVEFVRRAEEEHIRKRVAEENENRKRERSLSLKAQQQQQQQQQSSPAQAPCPLSPDDVAMFQRRKVEDYLNHGQNTSGESSYGALASHAKGLVSSSSEDYFSMTQSSDPPSVSASSSVGPDEGLQMRMTHRGHDPEPPKESASEDFGWAEEQPDYEADTDHTVESDMPLESDFDNSDEDFLVMGKKKKPARSSASISNAQLARSDISEVRRGHLSERRRSARSGSNGTVKKVEIPSAHEPEEK